MSVGWRYVEWATRDSGHAMSVTALEMGMVAMAVKLRDALGSVWIRQTELRKSKVEGIDSG